MYRTHYLKYINQSERIDSCTHLWLTIHGPTAQRL